MKKIIFFLSISFMFVITGCSSEVKIKIEFTDKVADRALAEKQIYNVIEFQGKPKKMKFNWSLEDSESNKSSIVVVSFLKKETLNKEKIDEIVININKRLARPDLKVTLDIEITDDNQEVLTAFNMKKNERYSAVLDWSKADVGIFYSQKPKGLNLFKVDYFCGIRIEPKSELPILTHNSFVKNETIETNKIIEGIEIGTDYDIIIEPARHDKLYGESLYGKYGNVYLMFSSAGSKSYYATYSFPDSSDVTETLESCKEIIYKRSNNNLYGLDNISAAVANVAEIKVLNY